MEATSASSSLVNDVVEEIFLRLPVKSLFRFKSVSKQWRCMIESRSFAERHLKIAERSNVENPKVMAISQERTLNVNGYRLDSTDLCFKTICSESASLLSSTLVNFPQGFQQWINVSESCDGLFCIHSHRLQSIYVVNPATRWLRQLPPAKFQILMHKFTPINGEPLEPFHIRDIKSVSRLAFVKAADYKLVWLYNSDKYNSDAFSPNEGLTITNCEVFDFRANAWRYLTCTPSYRIYYNQRPASANGSVYWFTEPYNGEIRVVALDIHTETFRVLPKINPAIASSDPDHVDMCALDKGLFMWKREPETMIEYIWRLKPSQDTWENIYTIDLRYSIGIRYTPNWTILVAVCKNEKILLNFRYGNGLMKYDPQTKSLSPIFKDSWLKYVPYFPIFKDSWLKYVPYFQSLISHI